jgi:hypothetical protein
MLMTSRLRRAPAKSVVVPKFLSHLSLDGSERALVVRAPKQVRPRLAEFLPDFPTPPATGRVPHRTPGQQRIVPDQLPREACSSSLAIREVRRSEFGPAYPPAYAGTSAGIRLPAN